jgi:hypothetical protein
MTIAKFIKRWRKADDSGNAGCVSVALVAVTQVPRSDPPEVGRG